MTRESVRDSVTMYTDGACSGNPGPGGWGAWIVWGSCSRDLCGGEAETTNNRMELLAAIEGLTALKRPCRVALYTDSRYVQMGIQTWISTWKEKGWRTASGGSVKNVDLWQRLEGLCQKHSVDWFWVRGHSNNAGNERADFLARKGLREVGVAGPRGIHRGCTERKTHAP